MLDERLLERMKRSRPAKPLDRRDRAAVILDRESEAGEDSFAVDQHGARTARALVAALFGSRKADVLTQEVEQRDAGIVR